MRIKKRFLLFILSFSILGILLYFSDIGKTLHIMAVANPFLLFVLFFLWIADTIVRTLRWQVLLGRIGIKTKFSRAWQIFVASMFFSNISPAKTGDPIRSVILKRTEDESFSSSLSSVVVERMLDVVFLLLVALISMYFLFAALETMIDWIFISLLLYVFVVGLGIFVITSEKRSEAFFTRLFRVFSFIPKVKSYESRVRKGSNKLNKAFVKYKHVPTLVSSFALTAVVWMIQGLSVYISFLSTGFMAQNLAWACIAVIPLSVLIGVMTFLPGAIGSSEVVTVTFFTSLFSVTLAQVTAVTLITRLFMFWPYIVLGAVIFSLKFK